MSVITDYLVSAPEQDDWEWRDHCEGMAGGILAALRGAGFLLLQPMNETDCYECGSPVAPDQGEKQGRAGWVHTICLGSEGTDF